MFQGRRFAAVKKCKLNYRFHDPNPAAVTADCILKVCVEASAGKAEAAIQSAASAVSADRKEAAL